MKRLFDFTVAALMLVLLSPVMLVVAALIRATSKGPAIFVQTRVGWHEQHFKCLKFRTMRADTPNVASHEVGAASITRLGHFLRSTKLDELPQLINVVRGEMSLVGPRPCLPVQDELVMERRRLGVFNVRPGITGSAQLAGIDMSNPKRLAKADKAYIDAQSFREDINLLVRTALGKGAGDAVKTR